jgi:serine/threonine-protein phosphatase 2A regulatory subunit A
MEENGLTLLKMEMLNEEIHVKVNAIHRLKTVILSIGPEEAISHLIPYIETLIKDEDDEVLFAIAEELGKCFNYFNDKTVFLGCLESLSKKDETVVRE